MTTENNDPKTIGGVNTGIEQWDLTSQVSPYLDRHMIFPLLEYLDTLISKDVIKSYTSKDVAEARLALLRPTHMIDYMIDVHKSIHGDSMEAIPKEMEIQKEKVFKERELLHSKCEPLEILAKDEEKRVSF
jgi:translation initiation factor 3 subunit E